MSAIPPRKLTTIRYDVLPGVSLDITYDTPSGAFYCAVLWESGWNRRDYNTERGMRAGVARLLAKIPAAEAAGGFSFWKGKNVPYAEHPLHGAAWADWTPADGPRWDAQDDDRNNKFHTPEHRAAVLSRAADPGTAATVAEHLAAVTDAKDRWLNAPTPAAQHAVRLELFGLIADAALAGASVDELAAATGWHHADVYFFASAGGVEYVNGRPRRTVKG